jgi:hypothetical protein
MIGLIFSVLGDIPVIGKFALWIAGLLGHAPPQQPAAVVEGQNLGKANEDVAGLEQENAELKRAAATRASVDADVVRTDPHANDVVTDRAAPINNLPGEVFRD